MPVLALVCLAERSILVDFPLTLDLYKQTPGEMNERSGYCYLLG